MKYMSGPLTVIPCDHLGDPAFAIRAPDGDLIAVGLLKSDADLFVAAVAFVQSTAAIDLAEDDDSTRLICRIVSAAKTITDNGPSS